MGRTNALDDRHFHTNRHCDCSCDRDMDCVVSCQLTLCLVSIRRIGV